MYNQLNSTTIQPVAIMAYKRSNNQKKRKNGKKGSKSATSTSTSTAMLHNLSLDSNDSTSTRYEQPSPLIRLPLEIREQIYTYLLDARYARSLSSLNYVPRIEDGMLRPTSGLKPFNFSLAILRANKQVHRESLHIFHTTNLFVRLSSTTTIFTGPKPSSKTVSSASSPATLPTSPPSKPKPSTSRSLWKRAGTYAARSSSQLSTSPA